jgi:hypothetical protein
METFTITGAKTRSEAIWCALRMTTRRTIVRCVKVDRGPVYRVTIA